jgi:hypothetical protein
MPRILQKPNAHQKITLSIEEHKPEQDRILWNVRVLDRSQLIEYEAELARIIRLPYDQQLERTVTLPDKTTKTEYPMPDLLCRVVMGWENVVDPDGAPLAFCRESLAIFTPQELIAIAQELPEAAGWGALRKKN